MNWYVKVMQNYFDFQGRATRAEYWYFTAFNLLFYMGASLIDVIIMIPAASVLYGLIVLVPGTAVFVRRLHDVGKSGWWIMLSFVPLVGFVILIYFLVQDSCPDNEYGKNPKTI